MQTKNSPSRVRHSCLFSVNSSNNFLKISEMVKEILVEGYEEYVKAAAENKGKQVFALFSGSKDANGESWCPDCLTGNYF